MKTSDKKPRPTPNFHFEVRRGKQTLMSTNLKSCAYDKKTRASMRKAGYSLFLNGKPFKESDLL